MLPWLALVAVATAQECFLYSVFATGNSPSGVEKKPKGSSYKDVARATLQLIVNPSRLKCVLQLRV